MKTPSNHEWRPGELPEDHADFEIGALLAALYIVAIILAIVGN